MPVHEQTLLLIEDNQNDEELMLRALRRRTCSPLWGGCPSPAC
jgi:hypothetical protein